MPLRVLIIPDKFKGTLTAGAAAEAIARGWRRARPQDALALLPLCDGGDGFGEVMSGLVGAEARTVRSVDAAHRRCAVRWWWAASGKTAIIESARVIGLAMLQRGAGRAPLHPFDLDTFGLGQVLRAAAAKGARRCLVGLGGSASNDGGFGLARALGWRFLDANRQALEHWTELARLARLKPPGRRRWFPQLVVAVDVRNPLLGPQGATRVYGPQKGLQSGDFARAERCLRRLADVAGRQLGLDFAAVPGAGAAGGLGFGLLAFAGARLESGFDLFARTAGLESRLCAADLVITAEGAIDASTFMGKGAGQVAQRCQSLNLACIGLAGVVRLERAERLKASNLLKKAARGLGGFSELRALTELTTIARAQAQPALWLERLAKRVAADQSAPP